MKCSKCGNEVAGKFCENCGTRVEQEPVPVAPVEEPVKKVKKPIYKKWWFLAIAIVIVVAIVGNFVSNNDRPKKINWSEIVLSSMLPEPESNKGVIYTNTADELNIGYSKTSNAQYNKYILDCKSKGFTVDETNESSSFDAYNADGYKLHLHYSDKKMTINLTAPMNFSDINWPTSYIGKIVPAPKSLVGKFSYENEDSFAVYVGNTNKSDYNEYVNLCSEKGFSVDYSKGDDYYYAENSQGTHISIKYEGNNIMYISVDNYNSDANSNSSITTTTTTTTTTSATSTTVKTTKSEMVNGMRKDFKEAMDSYESFMDEYVEFMKKYQNNPSDLSLLSSYASYMSKYADMCSKFEKWENEDLNNTELAYYFDVQARVSKKLLTVS